MRTSLQLLVDAGMNMVRIAGYMSYEDDAFWDLCDELGILVWQDCMLAGFDPPEEPEFVESVRLEVTQELGQLQRRPSLTVVCASSETQQQAAMFGLPSDGWHSPLLEETIPALVHELVPDVPCVVSSPSGGDLPFEPGQGIAHYFGVGAYLRPITDARAAGVRFAAECLAFGNPPEPSTVERCFGSGERRRSPSDLEGRRRPRHRHLVGLRRRPRRLRPPRLRGRSVPRPLHGSGALPRLRQGRGRPHHVDGHGGVALRTVALRGRA